MQLTKPEVGRLRARLSVIIKPVSQLIPGVGRTCKMEETEAADLRSRRPVWLSLTRVLIGNIMSEAERKEIVASLAQSPYGIDELNSILLSEVYPACASLGRGMFLPWQEADPTLLEQRILRGPSL